MANRRISQARRSTRRKLVWARSRELALSVGAAGVDPITTRDLLADFRSDLGVSANLPGFTVVRIRGVMTARPATLTAASQMRVAAKVDDSGTTAVGSSTEGPVVNQNDDWFLWVPFQYLPLTGGASPEYNLPILARHIDVKASRKLEEINQTVILAAQGADTGTWSLSYDLSLLIALP